MKVFFSLILFSLLLAACQGACMQGPLIPKSHAGKDLPPDTCVDVSDGKTHLIGSTWNTAHCLRCECDTDGWMCCHRYGGPINVLGCKTVVNPVTCEHEFYRLDDPSQRCDV
ncbi:PREDICTED: small serum protein 2-like [Thamnophis sirtalis]|uniref:Small serum protein 2-like n=1 Tax=Thamnophis sirtalis TaxID=35019 RepID=A0A6I9XJQ5_9SAUR|nr:PREDICTED: small serum protein 2-like [Thamnophis sirtalis]